MDTEEKAEVFKRLRDVEMVADRAQNKLNNGINKRVGDLEKCQEKIEESVLVLRLQLAKWLGIGLGITFLIQGAGATVIGIIVSRSLGS